MERLRDFGWLDLTIVGDISSVKAKARDLIDMDECSHSRDTANGGIHKIVPGRLLLIPSPVDLPDERCSAGWTWTAASAQLL